MIDDRPPALTPRLWEVVDSVGQGRSYGATAVELDLSIRTVEEYAAEIRARARLTMSPQRACIVLWERYRREVA